MPICYIIFSLNMPTNRAAHDPNDPEFSILKQRLARRLKQEGVSDDEGKNLDLVALTKARVHCAHKLCLYHVCW